MGFERRGHRLLGPPFYTDIQLKRRANRSCSFAQKPAGKLTPTKAIPKPRRSLGIARIDWQTTSQWP